MYYGEFGRFFGDSSPWDIPERSLGRHEMQQFLTRLAEDVTTLNVGVLSVKRLLKPRSTSEAAFRNFSSQ